MKNKRKKTSSKGKTQKAYSLGKQILKWSGIIVGVVTFLAAVAELSGYSVRDLFGGTESEKLGPTISTEEIEQKTEGDQSPAVIGNEVKINYGDDWDQLEEETPKDSTEKH